MYLKHLPACQKAAQQRWGVGVMIFFRENWRLGFSLPPKSRQNERLSHRLDAKLVTLQMVFLNFSEVSATWGTLMLYDQFFGQTHLHNDPKRQSIRGLDNRMVPKHDGYWILSTVNYTTR